MNIQHVSFLKEQSACDSVVTVFDDDDDDEDDDDDDDDDDLSVLRLSAHMWDQT